MNKLADLFVLYYIREYIYYKNILQKVLFLDQNITSDNVLIEEKKLKLFFFFLLK